MTASQHTLAGFSVRAALVNGDATTSTAEHG
jgi:hypothetical protein